jgi:hypothetical protein
MRSMGLPLAHSNFKARIVGLVRSFARDVQVGFGLTLLGVSVLNW